MEDHYIELYDTINTMLGCYEKKKHNTIKETHTQ